MPRRLAAVLALVSVVLAAALLVVGAVQAFPEGWIAIGLLVLASVSAWQGVLRLGAARLVWWVVAAVVLVAALVVLVINGFRPEGWLAVVLLSVAVALSRRVFIVENHLPAATPPMRPVVVWNPKSGGGKAVKANLASEAKARGIRPIELSPGDDLETLVRDAVAQGADGLMAAGGDGTQALVASVSAEHDLPFACIPAGTRNHFALDLGVDRDDVVGALDAFASGGEKRVDLATVNGRTFVNNVSLGIYAQAVQQEGYRDAKVRTLVETVPSVVGPGQAAAHPLRWEGPAGDEEQSAAVILVSNNAYRLGRILGAGTRPRMDAGTLGVVVVGGPADSAGRHRAVREWQTASFTVTSDEDVPLGVDGEALVMPSPVSFEMLPKALRVRIAPQHPGASPSAVLPAGLGGAVRSLVRVATGADPGHAPGP